MSRGGGGPTSLCGGTVSPATTGMTAPVAVSGTHAALVTECQGDRVECRCSPLQRASVSPAGSSPMERPRDARTDRRHVCRGKAGERRSVGPWLGRRHRFYHRAGAAELVWSLTGA